MSNKYLVVPLYNEPAGFNSGKYDTLDDLAEAETDARQKAHEDEFQPYSISSYEDHKNGYYHYHERVAIVINFNEIFYQG